MFRICSTNIDIAGSRRSNTKGFMTLGGQGDMLIKTFQLTITLTGVTISSLLDDPTRSMSYCRLILLGVGD